MAPLLSGCALLPGHPPTLQAGVLRTAIERATLVRLHEVTPPVAATGLQAMRVTMSGAGRGGTIATLVFWDEASSAMPLGVGRTTSTSVETRQLPGGLLAIRRLNVVVLYMRRSNGPNLSTSLQRVLADASAS
jgi:hypothetical protein